MTNISINASEAVVAVSVLLETSRNWENYDALRQYNETSLLQELKPWLQRQDFSLHPDLEMEAYGSQVFRVLRTDWSIGVARVINLLQRMSTSDKAIIRRYIDECSNPAISSLPGVRKALEIFEKQL